MIYVLGNGPAGMVAAHAINLSRGKKTRVEIGAAGMDKSVISGAQYLSGGVLGITGQARSQVKFVKEGNKAGYARKVYGDPMAPCSWDRYNSGGSYPMYDMRAAYDRMWAMYHRQMFTIRADANVMASFLDTNAELIISTVPRSALCYQPTHTFKYQTITVVNRLPHQVDVPEANNWIVYDGREEYGWYRCSKLNGHESTEFPGPHSRWMSTVGDDAREIQKPLWTDCDCWTHDRILQVGRYGKWDKDVLVHDVYNEVLRAVL